VAWADYDCIGGVHGEWDVCARVFVFVCVYIYIYLYIYVYT